MGAEDKVDAGGKGDGRGKMEMERKRVTRWWIEGGESRIDGHILRMFTIIQKPQPKDIKSK